MDFYDLTSVFRCKVDKNGAIRVDIAPVELKRGVHSSFGLCFTHGASCRLLLIGLTTIGMFIPLAPICRWGVTYPVS